MPRMDLPRKGMCRILSDTDFLEENKAVRSVDAETENKQNPNLQEGAAGDADARAGAEKPETPDVPVQENAESPEEAGEPDAESGKDSEQKEEGKAAEAEEPAEDAETEKETEESPQADGTLDLEAYDMHRNVFFALEEEEPSGVSEEETEGESAPPKADREKNRKNDGKLFRRTEKQKEREAREREKPQVKSETAFLASEAGEESGADFAAEEPALSEKKNPDKRQRFQAEETLRAEQAEKTEPPEETAHGDGPGQETPPHTMEERLALLGESVPDDGQNRSRTGVKNFAVLDTFNTLRDLFSDAESRKHLRVLGIPVNFLGIGIAGLFLLDMILLNFASYKIVYPLIERILKSNGVEALRLSGESFSKMFVGISYAASFLLGGLVVLLMARIAERLIRELSFPESSALISGIVGAMTFIFLIGAIVAVAITGNVLAVSVYRWAGPFFTYAGGLLFLMLSRISLRIDY